MAFPVVAASSSNFVNNTGSPYALSLPTGIMAGNLLLAVVASADGLALAWPAGWAELFDVFPGSGVGLAAAWRVADGSEGAFIDVTYGAADNLASFAYRIAGAASSAPEFGVAPAPVSTATPNPPSLSPSWGAGDTLWIAVGATDANLVTVSAYPANYGGNRLVAGSNVRIAAATRILNAANENPGAYTFSAANWATAQTLAVRAPAPSSPVFKPNPYQHLLVR